MRFFTLLLVLVLFVSIFNIADGAKDRKRKKQHRQEDSAIHDENELDEGGRFNEEDARERQKETRERVHTLIERQEERKEKKEEEESSEEKDDKKDEEKSNSTEIVIPRFKRAELTSLKRSEELNDGKNLPINQQMTTTAKKDSSSEEDTETSRVLKAPTRLRRSPEVQQMKKSVELNDGKHIPIGGVEKQNEKDNSSSEEKKETREKRSTDEINDEV